MADALDGGGRQKHPAEAGGVSRVQEVHHLPEGPLSFLLEAPDERRRSQPRNSCNREEVLMSELLAVFMMPFQVQKRLNQMVIRSLSWFLLLHGSLDLTRLPPIFFSHFKIVRQASIIQVSSLVPGTSSQFQETLTGIKQQSPLQVSVLLGTELQGPQAIHDGSQSVDLSQSRPVAVLLHESRAEQDLPEDA